MNRYLPLLAAVTLSGCANSLCVRDPLMVDDTPTSKSKAIVTLVDCRGKLSTEASIYTDGRDDIFFVVANKPGRFVDHEVPMTVSWQDDGRLLVEYDKTLKVIERKSPKTGTVIEYHTY